MSADWILLQVYWPSLQQICRPTGYYCKYIGLRYSRSWLTGRLLSYNGNSFYAPNWRRQQYITLSTWRWRHISPLEGHRPTLQTSQLIGTSPKSVASPAVPTSHRHCSSSAHFFVFADNDWFSNTQLASGCLQTMHCETKITRHSTVNVRLNLKQIATVMNDVFFVI